MDVMKAGRRRQYDQGTEELNHHKRRRRREIDHDNSDSVQFVGETRHKQPNCLSYQLDSPDNRALRHGELIRSTAPCNHTTNKRILANGTYANVGNTVNFGRRPDNHTNGSRAKERAVNGTDRKDPPSPSEPVLPPNLRESERMLFVQQWINSIPVTMPSWAQTSLNTIVPVSDTFHYPPEEAEKNAVLTTRLTPEYKIMVDGDQFIPHHHSQTIGPHKQNVRPPHNSPSSPSNMAPRSMLSPRYPNAPGVLIQLPPSRKQHQLELDSPYQNLQQRSSDVAAGDVHPGHPHRVPSRDVNHVACHPCRMNPNLSVGISGKCGVGKDHRGSVGRLFDDLETQMVVKLFRDYFTKGSCPILSEVRRRIVGTILECRRTATSIRSKIKRLQTSGHWTDYAGI